MQRDFIFAGVQEASYPEPPYHPPLDYPEFRGLIQGRDPQNEVYAAVRDLFLASGYDTPNVGTERWNPFRGLVSDGQSVLIKPNLVMHEPTSLKGSHCLTTHASVIRPILDYLWLLSKTDGLKLEVTIGDVPLQSAIFERVLEETGLRALQSHFESYPGLRIRLLDLRKEIADLNESGFIVSRRSNDGDPKGYTTVRLEQSFLNEIMKYYDKFSIGDYDDSHTVERHSSATDHHYLVCNSVLQADLFINVPKLKTHCKAGITVAMKNLIGINGDKSWIPHHRTGPPSSGGDEYSDEHRFIKHLNSQARRLLQGRSKLLWSIGRTVNRKIIRRIYSQSPAWGGEKSGHKGSDQYTWLMDGAWFGNDTLWRPILDLNRILIYADRNGVLRELPQRTYLCISDGIVAGEGDGPLNPMPKKAGVLTLSANPVIHDLCCARLMGFNWRSIPFLQNAIGRKFLVNGGLASLSIVELRNGIRNDLRGLDNLPNLHFVSPAGWSGAMELDPKRETAGVAGELG